MHTIQKLLNRFSQSSLGQFWNKINQDQLFLYASVIAYNIILNIFPITFALLAIIGLFTQSEGALHTVEDAIVHLLPAEAQADAIRIIEASRSQAGLFGIIGFLGLLWGGSFLFGAMATAFNRAFGVKDRDMIQQQLLGFGLIFLFAVLLIFSIFATSLATLVISFSGGAIPISAPGLDWLDLVMAWVTSLASNFLLFLVLYWLVPNRPFRFHDVWPGALLSAVLFFLIVQVWPIYLTYFGHFTQFGQLFGLLFLIMTWFYFVAEILLLGAELNAFLIKRRETRVESRATGGEGLEPRAKPPSLPSPPSTHHPNPPHAAQ